MKGKPVDKKGSYGYRQKWQIPTCKFCGQETDFGHICGQCKWKIKKAKKSMVK